jgi:hypothetical protein
MRVLLFLALATLLSAACSSGNGASEAGPSAAELEMMLLTAQDLSPSAQEFDVPIGEEDEGGYPDACAFEYLWAIRRSEYPHAVANYFVPEDLLALHLITHRPDAETLLENMRTSFDGCDLILDDMAVSTELESSETFVDQSFGFRAEFEEAGGVRDADEESDRRAYVEGVVMRRGNTLAIIFVMSVEPQEGVLEKIARIAASRLD